MLLHNKSNDNKGKQDFVDVIIEKNRDGEIGYITNSFIKPYQRFIEKQYDKSMSRYNEVPQLDFDKKIQKKENLKEVEFEF